MAVHNPKVFVWIYIVSQFKVLFHICPDLIVLPITNPATLSHACIPQGRYSRSP